MKTIITILAVLTLLSCTPKESKYDKEIRENNLELAKSKAKMDSINLELLKLGVKDEPGR